MKLTVIQRAKEGDKVLFTRKDISMIGTVKKVKEESVLVEISSEDAGRIRAETPFTVVSHQHYQIVVL
jgi:uncharacterized protein YkvS